jgi:hypothetical protein
MEREVNENPSCFDVLTVTCLPGWRRIFCWFDNLLGPHEQTRNVICRLHSWAMRTARWDEP